MGNAITREMHDEDMASSGSWVPTPSGWLTTSTTSTSTTSVTSTAWWSGLRSPTSPSTCNGRANTISQMKELIYQNYNHPCIVCWGVSNEITISTKTRPICSTITAS